MAKKKSEFRFIVNADPADINLVLNNYLTAHQFTPVAKPGANYFFFNDPIIKGKRSLEYYINGNEVVILAYLGTFERPQALEGFVGALPKHSYKNDLEPLFQELQRLNMQGGFTQPTNGGFTQPMNGEFAQPMNGGAQPVNGAYQQPYMSNGMPQQTANVFTEQANKSKETWTIVGFVMSLIGLLLSFFGMTYGVILLILEFYCGAQGLKTKKRGLAIATIVLASISLVIVLAEIILIFLYT